MSAQILLKVENLRVHYGKAEVLKGISLAVGEGNIVTLIGANGAGKTTTLRTISGLKKASAGQILFREQRIDGMKPHNIVRLGIGHIPEGRMIFAPMTVLDNLKLGAHARKDRSGMARDLERMYELFPILKQRCGQRAGSLSGGEQQMLATARALMGRPKLLLMDEPSMGLSPLIVSQLGKIIRDIKESGISVMLVEQNARMALNLADKAYVLEVGRIVREGEGRVLACDEAIREAYLGG